MWTSQSYGVLGAMVLLLGMCSCSSPPQTNEGAPSVHGELPSRSKLSSVEAEEGEAAPPSTSAQDTLARDLVREAGRAELYDGGLLIDIGSLDMHKYSRGGFLSGWGRNELDEPSHGTQAQITGRVAWLDVDLPSSAREIVVRAKGRGTLKVAVDKSAFKSSALAKDYQLLRIALAKPLAPGRHRIKLQGRKAMIDWVWLSEEQGQSPPSLSRVVDKALWSPTPRSYRFYLIPEPGASLHFRAKGDSAVTLTIGVAQDGKEPRTLYTGGLKSEVSRVDLSEFSGHPIRLSLTSTGGTVSWDELGLHSAPPKPSTIGSKPKNMIMLLIDTQRADSFSVVGDHSVGAAAYESLVKSSTSFRKAYNNENWTKPSIASIDTGLYPTSHLARWRKDKCASDLEFLSEHLQAQDFATTALVSNLSAGPKFGFNQGWDRFQKTDNAEHAFGRALEVLKARDPEKPFFLYIQTIDPHVPFSVPQGSAEALFGGPYKGKLGPSFEQSEEDALNEGKLSLSPDDAKWLQALYDAEVLYHDTHLGIFLKEAQALGIFEDTGLVVLNDHGEEMGEMGRWGHGWTMGDVLFRSPLLMHFPGLFSPQVVEGVVEHVDVAPTVVDSLGLPPMMSVQGESLLPRLQGTSAPDLRSALLFGRPKKRAIIVGEYKMVVQGNQEAALFHMPEDPKQTRDLRGTHPIANRLCELALGEAIANPKKSERLHDRSSMIKIRPEFISE